MMVKKKPRKKAPAKFDLLLLPPKEDDKHEFKSSQTKMDALKEKITNAVSAFGNSGGGLFVAGVDNNGVADGGLPSKVGRQELRDWAEQIIHQVEPVPPYTIDLIDKSPAGGKINAGHVVLVINVAESHNLPHMAPDKRYYIRAGTHTVSARHFIVEALLAKRHFNRPRISHLVRSNPNDDEYIQVGLIALTDAPAVDIELTIEPLPGLYREGCSEFPVQLGIIDKNNPFFFDVSFRPAINRKENNEFELRVKYHDLAKNGYTHNAKIDLFRSIPSLYFGKKDIGDVVKALESIKDTISPIFKNTDFFPTPLKEKETDISLPPAI